MEKLSELIGDGNFILGDKVVTLFYMGEWMKKRVRLFLKIPSLYWLFQQECTFNLSLILSLSGNTSFKQCYKFWYAVFFTALIPGLFPVWNHRALYRHDPRLHCQAFQPGRLPAADRVPARHRPTQELSGLPAEKEEVHCPMGSIRGRRLLMKDTTCTNSVGSNSILLNFKWKNKM